MLYSVISEVYFNSNSTMSPNSTLSQFKFNKAFVDRGNGRFGTFFIGLKDKMADKIFFFRLEIFFPCVMFH